MNALDSSELLGSAAHHRRHSDGAVPDFLARAFASHLQRTLSPNLRRERLFLGSLGFFVTLLRRPRHYTFAIHNNIGPFHDVSMHGRHIHHMVWGILLLLIVGYCWLAEIGTGTARGPWPIAARITSHALWRGRRFDLGWVGAIWLNLSDVYWQREGRESYEAMALFGSLLAMGVFGRPLLKGLIRELARPFRKRETSQLLTGTRRLFYLP